MLSQSASREVRLQKIVDEIEDYAIIILDQDGNIENWNKGAEKIKGYKESEIIGKNFRVFYTPEDQNAGVPEALLAAAAERGKAKYEGWRVKKTGELFWGNILITAIHDDANNVIGFTKLTRDLTDKKITEETLRQSEERYYRMIAEVQDYAIIMLDRDGFVVNWNKGAERIKGYKADEIIGKNFRCFYTLEDLQNGEPERLINLAIEEGRAYSEGWRLRKDKSRFWGSITITALRNDSGELLGFSKVTRDLTERKEAEKQQEKYLQEILKKNKELEHFNFIASHDLQEPLNSVTSLVKLFEDEIESSNLSEEAKESFVYIQRSVERMRVLIRGLLEYGQLGRVRKLETVDCNELLDQVCQSLVSLIKKSNSRIIKSNLPTIDAYKTEFQLVFQNLLCNAIKFKKPACDPEVEIWAEEEDSCWKFCVKDNGIGIDPKYQEKIFIIFQRLHRVDQFEGSGIGLAHCKKIVDLHNGKIWVESEVGKGSIFYFTISKTINNASNI